eukprot:31026-Pelagococcus_subviridis.AAC.5
MNRDSENRSVASCVRSTLRRAATPRRVRTCNTTHSHDARSASASISMSVCASAASSDATAEEDGQGDPAASPPAPRHESRSCRSAARTCGSARRRCTPVVSSLARADADADAAFGGASTAADA